MPKDNIRQGINKFVGSTSSIGGNVQDFLQGTPEKRENVSNLRPEQEDLYQQLINSGMNPGAGGAFGTAADYYRSLLGDDSADFNALSAPALRQYNEEIVPGLSEQFAGMGSGGLSSSGFRNAQIQGATDLSERLGALRAQLRQHGAAGLQSIGQSGLGNFSNNMTTEQGTPGFLSTVAPAIGTAVGSFAGPAGAAAGNAFGNWLKGPGIQPGGITAGDSNNLNSLGGNKVGSNSSPYGAIPKASPQFGGGLQQPNFMMR